MYVFSCVQRMVWLPVFGVLMCAQMFMYMIVHRGCTDTVKETTLGEKALATPGTQSQTSVILAQVWLFSQTLYQLSYS